jgi:cell surface protein SprA
MKIRHILIFATLVFALDIYASNLLPSRNLPNPYTANNSVQTVTDTLPLKERMGDFITDKTYNPFDLDTKEVEKKVEFDPKSGQYIVYEKVGGQFVRTPTYLTFEEYLEYTAKEQEKQYFNTLAGIKSDKKSHLGRINPMDKIDLGGSLVDRLFGGTEVNIQPQGNVDLSVGWIYSKFSNPALPPNAQKFSSLDFPTPIIKMNVDGKIGKKLDLGFNYDTQSNFDFDRVIKLGFDSQSFSEDDIIKKIEAGNVSLPLRGTLIQGAQSLFGLKTELQFGRLRLTALASQQRSKNNNIKIENGESIQDFVIYADEYDENRHFFISHFNRSTYESSLKNMPFIGSSQQIAQIEVWVSDDRQDSQDNTAMIAAISDLGEPNKDKFLSDPLNVVFTSPPTGLDTIYKVLPRNEANDIYKRVVDKKDIEDVDKVSTILTSEFRLKRVRDFEVFRGRKLSPSEYTYHPKLGTLSLNSRLRPNQVLGIAYNYYFTTVCDSLFQVGMLTASSLQAANQTDTTRVEPPKVHFVKLLKSTNQVTKVVNGAGKTVVSPQWELMMKNVYPLRASQLNPKDFVFDIYYEDDFSDGSLKKYIPHPGATKVPLLQLFNLDKLNRYNDPQPDGYFDYVPGVTVVEKSGSIIIPVLEPFGSHLSVDNFMKYDPDTKITQKEIDDLYKYQQLYDSTITLSRLNLVKNKFNMRGRIKSSNNNGVYPLGPFVPQGSVRVTAGGRVLVENQDYEIDYGAGRLTIINEAYLNSGTPVNIAFEDNSAFNLQQKSMLGLRAEYQFNKKSSLGFTYLKVFERPYTLKVNIEDDPIKNRMLGLDYNLDNDLPWLTKALDKLPFYSTAEKSKINLTSEIAMLLPDHANGIDTDFDKTGIANLDDFEGAVNSFNLGGFATNQWILASTPETFGQKEGLLSNNVLTNINRAKFNWYTLDFGINKSNEDNSDPYTIQIAQDQFFKRRTVQPGQNIQFTFDLSYYPSERGPYNYEEKSGVPGYSKGFEIMNNTNIVLNEPKSRWGGIMRYFPNADFEAANYENIEFWMMNPFEERRDGNHDANEEGEIVFNLGSVSEDVMKDNLLYFENAIPTTKRKVPTTNTAYGKATVSIPLVAGFDLQDGKSQDLGFDGLNDAQEQDKFEGWINRNQLSSIPEVFRDPSNDNFVFFNDQSLANETNLLNKMKFFNGTQGNAPLDNATGNGNENEFVRGNRYPETEDLNNNRTLDQAEAYYEYKLKIKNKAGFLDTEALGKNYRQSQDIVMGNKTVRWYRIQIPITNNDKTAINGISGFRSIQFMRMYVTNFSKPKTFRLLEFQLQRSQWRKLPEFCRENGDPSAIFNIDDVGVEENSEKLPFNYVEPVQRTAVTSSFGNFLQDEKSLVLKFSNLNLGCELKVNKLYRYNLSLYKRLQLFVHAEGIDSIPKGDLSVFVRIGKDYENNYYEYELPLTMSDPKAGIATPTNIWPDANYINIPLDSLLLLKKERITDNGLSSVERSMVINPSKNDVVRMIGNPSLGAVKSIVIGVRNKSTGTSHSGEVWVNELRVTGYDESASMAVESKVQIQMADLGEMNLSGGYSSAGFGTLQDRLHERTREKSLRYDIGTNIDAGKLLPKALKLVIPTYAQYQKEVITPEYDPYDLDIKVKDKLALIKDPVRRAETKDIAKEQVTIKTFNLTNVKTSAGNPAYPWSPSNLSATYAYTENIKSDPIIKEDKTTTRNIGLDYAYSRKSNYVEPLKFIKPKALKLFSDFNFSPLPNNFTFTTRMNDLSNSRTFRLPDVPVFIFDDKRLSWERNYVLNWDLTRSIRVNFRANTNSIVDQLRQVGIDSIPDNREWVDEFGRSVTDEVNKNKGFVSDYRIANIKKLGRSKNYDHNIAINYKLPFKNIPFMEWVQGTVDYKADYAWEGGSLVIIDNKGTPLGNVLKNGQNTGVNLTFNFDRLYAKSSYLKSIETGKGVKKPKKAEDKSPLKRGKEPQRSNDKRGDMMAMEKEKEEPSPDADGGDDSQKDKDTGGKKKDSKEKKEKEDKPRDPSLAERIIIRPLLLIRNIKMDYKEEKGTIIPGFMPESSLFGLSDGFGSPGWQFASGVQPRISGENNWLQTNKSWFNNSENFNDALSQSRRQKIEFKAAIEPLKDFNIDVSMKRNYSLTHTEVFRVKGSMDPGNFSQQAKYDVGSFDATFMGLNTLFNNSDNLYEIFKNNRQIISRRLPNIENPGVHPTEPSYVEGYGPTSYAVNIPAFLAAYTNKSAYNIELDQQKKISRDNYIPKPNWQLNYNGLSKLKMFKKIFSNISVKHGYISTIRMNDFHTEAQYTETKPYEISPNDNYFARFEMSSVIIQEQFAPIIGISVKTHKDMKIDFEYKKSRNLELGATTLNESNSSEISLGAGYVIKDLKAKSKKKKSSKKKKIGEEDATDEKKKGSRLPSLSFSKNKDVKKSRDLKFNVNYSVRDDLTVRYDLQTGVTGQSDRGTKNITLNPTVEYDLNDNLALRFYFDYSKSIPKTSSTFPTTTIRSGITFRFTIN